MVYFNTFRDYLHNLYKSVILNKITILEDCNGITIRKSIRPATYSKSNLKEIFNDKKLLKLYFDIRFIEEERMFSESEKNRIVKDSLRPS